MKRDEFLALPTEGVRELVQGGNYPHTGIFVSDGNRRLVMADTGLTPEKDGFYETYIETVTRYFMRNLAVFFGLGLNTLFFPLFSSSLLKRCDRFREMVMPELVRLLFSGGKWLDFYRDNGIRLKAYGNPERLGVELSRPELVEIIRKAEVATAGHKEHSLFIGFFSEGIREIGFLDAICRFRKVQQRIPEEKELMELYYGEALKKADFLINSTRMASLGALPPMLHDRKTMMYTLAVPAVLGLTDRTYRDILYDLLFLR
ncbi:MAG: hypothetical protein GY757_21680, partial [bacterium]|nr:hypothetical protein [bacterium]